MNRLILAVILFSWGSLPNIKPNENMNRLILAVILFSGVLLLQATWFRQTKSITYDESYYLSFALRTLESGRLDPRFASFGVAPLPVLLAHVVPLSLGQREREETELSRRRVQAVRLIGGPRLANSIFIGVPLLLTVAVWLYRRKGAWAAAAGAGLVAFSPAIIAHASLAATDACFALFVLLALATVAWHFSGPSRLRFLGMAAAISAAMAAKYSGIFLLAVAAILFALRAFVPAARDRPLSRMRSLRELVVNCAVLALLIAPMCWALHLFNATALFDGVRYQYLHNQVGHCAFLMGERSTTGWWSFFPLAMFMKSTPVELLLLGGLLVLLLASLRSPWQTFRGLDVQMRVLGLASLVFGLMLVTSRINIGHRYLLPLYPVLVIAGVDRLWEKIGTSRSRLPSGTSIHTSHSPSETLPHRSRSASGTCLWVAAVLVVGQAASCLSIAPHYLAYFNRLVGGPAEGWHYLVDSSIDWGQDLPSLSAELKRLGYRRIALEYFGTAGPWAYGVEADALSNLRQPLEAYEAVAVSVTNLQGLYTKTGDPFRELRQVPPVALAGYSILIYDLSDRRAQRAFRAAAARFRETNPQ